MITRKPQIAEQINKTLAVYRVEGLVPAVVVFHECILSQKIKFPLLEYAAMLLYDGLPPKEQLPFCDAVERLKTIGGNVILGKMLQLRLNAHFQESIDQAAHYISGADVWYICDIIGERVFGHSLLTNWEKTLIAFTALAQSGNRWVIRSLGAGAHYAIKKGLHSKHVESIFDLLLTMASSKDKEIRQGIGWAAKTTAKFHPDIIQKNKHRLDDQRQVANWFRRKIRIGLERNQYAQGN